MNSFATPVAAVSLSEPSFWAGLSMALAFFLLLKNCMRFFLPLIFRVGGQLGPTTGGNSNWEPSLEIGDRRRSFRRAGNPVPLLLVGLDGNRRFEGRVLDRSRDGLRVESPRPARVDSVLIVRACQAPDDVLWVPIRVRWCRNVQGATEIGCQFADTLPLTTLRLFG
jgi:hypothetical protein